MLEAFLTTLLKAISSLFGFLQQNQLVEAGENKVKVEQAKKETESVINADEARAEAATASATVPVTDSLPDDGFRRD